LEATRRHALDRETSGGEVARRPERRFDLRPLDLRPRGYYRLRSNLIEMMARFALPATELAGAPGAGRPDRHGRTGSEGGDVPA
jgi:hypothetical protein